jgi:hypothetical protein
MLVSSIVIEMKILLIEKILDHFVRHPVCKVITFIMLESLLMIVKLGENTEVNLMFKQ